MDPNASRSEAGGTSRSIAPETTGAAPTRRRLLALMGSLATASNQRIDTAPTTTASSSRTPTPDPIPSLFAEYQTLLTNHEAALAEADWLEAGLVADIGYPRVRLPSAAGIRARFAADWATIEQHVPQGRQRERLQRAFQRRQRLWVEAAVNTGLTAALAREAAAGDDVLAAVSTLLATPASTATGIMLKLLVLLSWQEPGASLRDTSPWRELRLILSDLDALTAWS
ncbi:hypothetical protein MKK69_13770 [Methylobacterium sp. J-026]|uniref:hypothetical protein n=1 Tax=Methylobacterium sp. J-026 TaxID=2836624 RepID=UPI001FBB7796|nr:hypothetical protein [Methylobacterium sp. J-026]MCJ2135113.1 hypothetical protein [Methylobacterium sp. J-026]